jgi:hypothetical protein
MGGKKYSIGHLAYLKIVLHAAKYPHACVNGLLLSRSSSGPTVEVNDAVPLLHRWTTLSPMMEVALDLVNEYGKKNGCTIVGYYHAEPNGEPKLTPVGQTILGSLVEKYDGAFALVVDSQKLGTGEPAIVPFASSGPKAKSWRPLAPIPSNGTEVSSSDASFRLTDTSSPRKALDSVRTEGLHQFLGDFDDHLEDASIDWLTCSGVSNRLE